MNKITIHIMIGLPGCGKTTFANTLINENVALISEDDGPMNLPSEVVRRIHQGYNEVVIDILIMNMKLLSRIKERISEACEDLDLTVEYKLYVFRPNLEWSLVNDFIRGRSKSAKQTINFMYNRWDFKFEEFENIIVMDSHKPSMIELLLYDNKVDPKKYKDPINELKRRNLLTNDYDVL